MSKIFCFVDHAMGDDVAVLAVTEDGYAIARHISSSVDWAKYDIGITSERKHERYQEKFPDGYELEWVDLPDSHEGLRLAEEAAKARER